MASRIPWRTSTFRGHSSSNIPATLVRSSRERNRDRPGFQLNSPIEPCHSFPAHSESHPVRRTSTPETISPKPLLIDTNRQSEFELFASTEAPVATPSSTAPNPDFIDTRDGRRMALIPAGAFQMGTMDRVSELEHGKRYIDTFNKEIPEHTVHLAAYFIDTHPVTNTHFNRFLEETGQEPLAAGSVPELRAADHPVVGISWAQAAAYASWAGKRLPTEAEWEKAARGGLVQRRHSWGDEAPNGSQCNFADQNCPRPWRTTEFDDGFPLTSPVGSFPPNGYGLFDMIGNVWEWCYDDCRIYTPNAVTDPVGPLTPGRRAIRGGDWTGPAFHQRCSRRDQRLTEVSGPVIDNVGFRCALSADAYHHPPLFGNTATL